MCYMQRSDILGKGLRLSMQNKVKFGFSLSFSWVSHIAERITESQFLLT